MQAGARRYPSPPFPKQHLKKPGREGDLELRPMYDAPSYKGSDKLLGMAALITGADSGIDRAVAVLFAREGADVAVAYLNEHADAEETKHAVEQEGRRCILLAGDVADPDYCRDAVEETVHAFGRLDILVNNAAFQEHADSFEDLTEEHFDQTIKTNIYGYFHMAKAAVPHMKRGSFIVMTGSVTGILGSANLLDYSMTKGAIHAFTRSLATSGRARYSRQRSHARAGVDAVQSGRQAGRGGEQIRRRRADETPGTAGGNRACLCVHGGAELRELHHRRNPADHWRLFGRLARVKQTTTSS
jgi:NAD(P)-dependent dehydrogenase (short-subunit alcohol dehydrogenase family)